MENKAELALSSKLDAEYKLLDQSQKDYVNKLPEEKRAEKILQMAEHNRRVARLESLASKLTPEEQ